MAAAGHIEISHMCFQLSVWHKSDEGARGTFRRSAAHRRSLARSCGIYSCALHAEVFCFRESLIGVWTSDWRGLVWLWRWGTSGILSGDAPHGSGPTCVAGKAKAMRGGAQLRQWMGEFLHIHVKKTGVNVDNHAVTLSLPPPHRVKQGLLPYVAMSNVNPTWLFSFRYELLHVESLYSHTGSDFQSILGGGRVRGCASWWQTQLMLMESSVELRSVIRDSPQCIHGLTACTWLRQCAELRPLSTTRGQQSLPPECEPLHSRSIGANPGTTGHENAWPAHLLSAQNSVQKCWHLWVVFFLLCNTQT